MLFNEIELNKSILWKNRNICNVIITPHMEVQHMMLCGNVKSIYNTFIYQNIKIK